MAINLRDFGNYLITRKRLNVPLNINCDPETSRRIHNKEPYIKSKEKWWNKIIPKAEEGQVIPNGISYKRWRNNFKLMLRIYKLRINLSLNYYPIVNDYWELENRIKKPSFGFGFSCQYN